MLLIIGIVLTLEQCAAYVHDGICSGTSCELGNMLQKKASSITCRLGPEAMLVFVLHHELIV